VKMYHLQRSSHSRVVREWEFGELAGYRIDGTERVNRVWQLKLRVVNQMVMRVCSSVGWEPLSERTDADLPCSWDMDELLMGGRMGTKAEDVRSRN
jgi:hypothetical protein